MQYWDYQFITDILQSAAILLIAVSNIWNSYAQIRLRRKLAVAITRRVDAHDGAVAE